MKLCDFGEAKLIKIDRAELKHDYEMNTKQEEELPSDSDNFFSDLELEDPEDEDQRIEKK